MNTGGDTGERGSRRGRGRGRGRGRLQPLDITIHGSPGFSSDDTLANTMGATPNQMKPSNPHKPILLNFEDVLIPPGKYSEEVVALNEKLGGLYFPRYSTRSHFPDIQRFRDKFSVEELRVADALWHNVTNNLIVSFRQNIVAVIRYMREQRLLAANLKGESSKQKTELSVDRYYKRIEFSINLEVPLKSDHNACIPPNQEFKSDKSLAMTWASRITEGEHPEGTSLISGYLPCLPIVWINDCSKKLTSYPFLFKHGMVGQISVKAIEDTHFLGKEISEQLTAMEDFLPAQISVWSTAPDYSQGSYVSEFHLLRIIDEEPEGLKTLASDEVEPLSVDQEDLSRMRGHAIRVITEKLQDTAEKWYTLYSSERCIIQTAETYDGKISKGKQKQTVKIPATLLDATFVGHFDPTTRERLNVIIAEDAEDKTSKTFEAASQYKTGGEMQKDRKRRKASSSVTETVVHQGQCSAQLPAAQLPTVE
jgi:hypothetical protein